MIVYRDMTFCDWKECPNTFCNRHYSKIPWDKLPEWMGVSISDFGGKYQHCPTDPGKMKEFHDDET